MAVGQVETTEVVVAQGECNRWTCKHSLGMGKQCSPMLGLVACCRGQRRAPLDSGGAGWAEGSHRDAHRSGGAGGHTTARHRNQDQAATMLVVVVVVVACENIVPPAASWAVPIGCVEAVLPGELELN